MNYKRVERLYREERLQVRRRRRKKVPLGERQPLLRPIRANEVWSMGFVFDRTADGRVIKCLVIVDDATHEPVAIDVERAISGQGVCRVLDRLALSRGLPKVIRTDNGKEFCGKAMVTWAHDRGVQLRLIVRAWSRLVNRCSLRHSSRSRPLNEPGKPNQNAYVESVIETWRREYNEERPKKALGGLTPEAYAKTLAASGTPTADSKADRY